MSLERIRSWALCQDISAFAAAGAEAGGIIGVGNGWLRRPLLIRLMDPAAARLGRRRAADSDPAPP